MDDTKDTKDIKETGEAASVLSADEQMIQDGFNALLNDYLKSNHRRKVERITKAFNFANQAHAGVKRRSGEPYIMHPIAVARIVCREMGLGSTSICSALLHDVVEDGGGYPGYVRRQDRPDRGWLDEDIRWHFWGTGLGSSRELP